MRVLVTGAYGFVGTAVVHRLSQAGHEVIALTHRAPSAPLPVSPAAGTRYADLRDADALRDAVHGIEAVCHLAALTRVRESFERPDEYRNVNVGGTQALLDAVLAQAQATGTPLRFIHASTAAVYGVPEIQPITEDAPCEPKTPYGETKLAADQAVAQAADTGSIGVIVLRAFNISGAVAGHGDPDESRIIPKAVAVAAGRASHVDINGDGTAIRDFVHVDDLARAYVLALDACEPGKHRVYNVGATPASVSDIVAETERVTHRPVPVVHNPPKPEPPTLTADTHRIRDELGWKPERSTLQEILADTWAAAGA